MANNVIPDNQVQLDAPVASSTAAIPDDQVQLDQPVQGAASATIPDDQVQINKPEADPVEQMVNDLGSGLEGVVKGFISPTLTGLAESGLSKLGVPGLSPQDQAAREQQSSIPESIGQGLGVAGSLMTGYGEAALLNKGAQALLPQGASVMAKIATSALSGLIQAGIITGDNKASQALLGTGDPNDAAVPAILESGAIGLITGAIFNGGTAQGLKALGESKAGTKAAQFIEDFGNQWKFNQENPGLFDSVLDEFTNLHDRLKSTLGSVWSKYGIKPYAVGKLTQSVTPQNLADHLSSVNDAIDSAPEAFKTYGPFQDAVNAWRQAVTPTKDLISMQPTFTPTAENVFNATDNFKRSIGEWAYPKGNPANIAFSERPLINGAKVVYSGVQTSLEDPSVWGDLGRLQMRLNKATSGFADSWKELNKRFSQNVEYEPIVDPGKIQTYVNQLGNPRAVIKQGVMKSAVESGQNFLNEVNDIYGQFGLPLQSPASTNAIQNTYGVTSGGKSFANQMFHYAVPQFTAHVAGEAGGGVGAYIGYKEGREHGGILSGIGGAIGGGLAGILSPHIAGWLTRNIAKSVVPGVLRVLSSGVAQDVVKGLDYADQVNSGAQIANRAIDGLFKGANTSAFKFYESSDRDREKLKSSIEGGDIFDEMQNTLNQQNQSFPQSAPSPQPQGFAEGGDVQASPIQPQNPEPINAKNQGNTVFNGSSALSRHFPEQNAILQGTKLRVANYLNSIRPLPPLSKLPFDETHPDPQAQRQYNKALDLANNPIGILKHVHDGTLGPVEMNHFKSMYPEVHDYLSKGITERITKAQLNGEKPPYKLRQSLSMFLGSPLDSSMSPSNIMAAQAVFQQMHAQNQQAATAKPKKGTSTLGKVPQNYMTDGQAREQRQNKV